jgi:putative N6-adenine-specific DNA methylase
MQSTASAPGKTSHRFFVACSPGLESLLVEELASLGVRGAACPGGAEARGTIEALWASCTLSRLAESVRVRMRPFEARDFDALLRGLERLPWHAYLPQGASVRVSVTCHHSRLWHSDAVAERVLDVLARRRGVRPERARTDEEEAGEVLDERAHDARLFVRLMRDEVQVSIDASGERLHRRGYRTHVAEASLRETLAAALVHVARRQAPDALVLWDPFCGAGTIPLEWLESGLGRAAGARRSFAFERWPTHDARGFASFRAELANGSTTSTPSIRTWGSDISERAISAARNNAELAGLSEYAHWFHGDFEQAAREVPRGALVISNPPYGVRVDEGNVLVRLGRVLGARKDLRPVVLMLGGPARRWQSGLPFSTVTKTKNGGLPVRIELLR